MGVLVLGAAAGYVHSSWDVADAKMDSKFDALNTKMETMNTRLGAKMDSALAAAIGSSNQHVATMAANRANVNNYQAM